MSTSGPILRTDLPRAALERWHGDPGTLRLVGDSDNLVHAFLQGGETCFLRLTSARHRTRGQIEAELDFIAHLHGAGVAVSLAVPSVSRRHVEELASDDGPIFACVFEEAPGDIFRYDAAGPNESHFRLRGRTLGRIHAAAKTYVPSGPYRRLSWDEDDLWRNARQYVPESEHVALAEYERLNDWLSGLPQDEASFGLIHGDFGPTNYRYAGDLVTVFDFDDCCRHWFPYDIAVSVYPHGTSQDRASLLRAMIEGYREETDLDRRWLPEITNFCRLRVLYMFVVYAKRWGFSRLSGQQARWFAQKREVMARPVEWQV